MDSTSDFMGTMMENGTAGFGGRMTIYGRGDTYEILPIGDGTYSMSCVFPIVPIDFYDADSTLGYCTICNVLASVA